MLRCVTLGYVALRNATVRYVTYVTLCYVTLRYVTVHYRRAANGTLARRITLHYITLHYITLHYSRAANGALARRLGGRVRAASRRAPRPHAGRGNAPQSRHIHITAVKPCGATASVSRGAASSLHHLRVIDASPSYHRHRVVRYHCFDHHVTITASPRHRRVTVVRSCGATASTASDTRARRCGTRARSRPGCSFWCRTCLAR